jgi:hypothetical protein
MKFNPSRKYPTIPTTTASRQIEIPAGEILLLASLPTSLGTVKSITIALAAQQDPINEVIISE